MLIKRSVLIRKIIQLSEASLDTLDELMVEVTNEARKVRLKRTVLKYSNGDIKLKEATDALARAIGGVEVDEDVTLFER